MDNTARFKIDICDRFYPFGLYHKRRGWFSSKWVELKSFEKREEALAYYDLIKDLPEYLA